MTPNTLEAVVEGGLLRPLTQLDLPEHQHVLVTVIALKDEVHDSEITCYQMAIELGLIGTADETPVDLSTNPTHLSGFGS